MIYILSYQCGNIYYQDYNSETGLIDIKKVVIDSSFEVTVSDYASVNMWFNPQSSYKLDLQDRTIIIYTFEGKIYEVYNPSNNPREVILSGLSLQSITTAESSDNYYYIAGSNSSSQPLLIKVNPINDSYNSLTTPSEYDIYKMSVSDHDEIIFNALRMADSAKIIGKIDALGQLTILDETLNTEVVVLERIN